MREACFVLFVALVTFIMFSLWMGAGYYKGYRDAQDACDVYKAEVIVNENTH